MRSSTIILGLLSLIGSAIAGKHHNCGCDIQGKYDVDLSHKTCDRWARNNNPNTHFDGYSCVDKGTGRGIDGAPWEATCRDEWTSTAGHLGTDVTGDCWHDTV